MHFSPYYAFTRYFLAKSDWYKYANDHINILRTYKMITFKFKEQLYPDLYAPLISLCRCIGPFTTALFRLNKSESLKDIYI